MRLWFPIAVAVAVLSLGTFGFWAIQRSNDYADSCAEAGGVAVKAYAIRATCIDRNSLIEVPR